MLTPPAITLRAMKGRTRFIDIDNQEAGLAAAKINAATCRKGGKVLVLEPSEEAEAQSSRFLAFTQHFKVQGQSANLVFFQRP